MYSSLILVLCCSTRASASAASVPLPSLFSRWKPATGLTEKIEQTAIRRTIAATNRDRNRGSMSRFPSVIQEFQIGYYIHFE